MVRTNESAERIVCEKRKTLSNSNQRTRSMRAKTELSTSDVVIDNDTITLDRVEGRTIDMELVIRPEDKENVYKNSHYVLHRMRNSIQNCFRPYESVLKIDRKFSGSERALVHQSSCLVNGDCQ